MLESAQAKMAVNPKGQNRTFFWISFTLVSIHLTELGGGTWDPFRCKRTPGEEFKLTNHHSYRAEGQVSQVKVSQRTLPLLHSHPHQD